MDPIQCDMDYSDCSEEEVSLKRKLAKSPALSTINEEASWASESLSSSEGLGSINHKPQSKEMTAKRKLFYGKDDGMELDLSGSDCFDSTPPPKDQKLPKDAPRKQKRSERNLEKEVRSKTGRTPKTPLRDRNQPDVPNKLTPKTEGSKEGNGGPAIPPAIPPTDASDPFDKLFVCGIFNTVKPAQPTSKELQAMYINNSSDDDDDPPTSNKRRKQSPPTKKKVQSKLTFKKVKKARTCAWTLDSESDSDL